MNLNLTPYQARLVLRALKKLSHELDQDNDIANGMIVEVLEKQIRTALKQEGATKHGYSYDRTD